MFPIVLAAVSALAFGTSDFSGGKAAQRASPVAVTVFSQLCSLPLLAVLVLATPGTPNWGDLGWGLLAGFAGASGIMLLYRALAAGAMAVVAPVTAVTSALIPIAVGLLTAQSPGTLALTGTGLAVLAIGLVSIAPNDGPGTVSRSLAGLALVAGALFGIFFALLGQAGEEAGMWPLVAVRVSSIGLGLIIVARAGLSLRLGGRVTGWAAAAGILDITANALFLVAAARGHLSTVAAISSLYPVSTVLLALAVDRERLRPVQLAGLVLAATALLFASS